jgi:hypothetical protein
MSTPKTCDQEITMTDEHAVPARPWEENPTVADAAATAVAATHELDRHPNSPAHVKARTMAVVRLVCALEAAGHVADAQTLAAQALGGRPRQVVNRMVTRAIARGWAHRDTVDGVERLTVTLDLPGPTQTEFADVVEMERIGPLPAAVFLPPFEFANEVDPMN